MTEELVAQMSDSEILAFIRKGGSFKGGKGRKGGGGWRKGNGKGKGKPSKVGTAASVLQGTVVTCVASTAAASATPGATVASQRSLVTHGHA